MQSLWGNDIKIESVSEVKTTMQIQASLLGKLTKNLVEAKVYTLINSEAYDGGKIRPQSTHCFQVLAPILAYSEFTLFCVEQFVGKEYPVVFYSEYWTEGRCICNNVDEFKDCLQKVLTNPVTSQLINGIIAQSKQGPSSVDDLPF